MLLFGFLSQWETIFPECELSERLRDLCLSTVSLLPPLTVLWIFLWLAVLFYLFIFSYLCLAWRRHRSIQVRPSGYPGSKVLKTVNHSSPRRAPSWAMLASYTLRMERVFHRPKPRFILANYFLLHLPFDKHPATQHEPNIQYLSLHNEQISE